jgi:glucosamine-phosphate N-acetyltransferase
MSEPLEIVARRGRAGRSQVYPDGLVIRPFELGDLQRGFLETLSALAPTELTPEEAESICQARCARGIRTFVALLQGRVVGTASLFCEPKLIHSGGWVGHIEDVAVHPECRRRGIGTALVKHLVEEAQANGCYKVILNCYEHLLPFYQRAGFRAHDICLRRDLYA